MKESTALQISQNYSKDQMNQEMWELHITLGIIACVLSHFSRV